MLETIVRYARLHFWNLLLVLSILLFLWKPRAEFVTALFVILIIRAQYERAKNWDFERNVKEPVQVNVWNKPRPKKRQWFFECYLLILFIASIFLAFSLSGRYPMEFDCPSGSDFTCILAPTVVSMFAWGVIGFAPFFIGAWLFGKIEDYFKDSHV